MNLHEGYLEEIGCINVLAVIKGRERYIFVYNDNHRKEMLGYLGKFASNPELSFTWYDAAVLSYRVSGIKKDKIKSKPVSSLKGLEISFKSLYQ